MQKIKGFDGIRAISIILVMLMHIGLASVLQAKGLPAAFYEPFTGDVGVRVFFVLSGFLITSVLWSEKEKKGRIQIGKFYMRRALRLLPAMIIFALLVLLTIRLEGMKADWISFAYAFLYAYNYVPIEHYQTELGHMWSLALEEQFYLIWPLALIIFRKRVLLFVLLSVLIFVCVLHPYAWASRGVYFGQRFFIPAGISIFFGSALALLKTYTTSMLSWNKSTRVISILGVLIIYLSSMWFMEADSEARLIIFNLCIAFFILWIYTFQESLLVKWLEWKPLAFIGVISYGLYIYQGLFLRTGPGGELAIQQFPINLLLLSFCAIISYFSIEKWALRFKKH